MFHQLFNFEEVIGEGGRDGKCAGFHLISCSEEAIQAAVEGAPEAKKTRSEVHCETEKNAKVAVQVSIRITPSVPSVVSV